MPRNLPGLKYSFLGMKGMLYQFTLSLNIRILEKSSSKRVVMEYKLLLHKLSQKIYDKYSNLLRILLQAQNPTGRLAPRRHHNFHVCTKCCFIYWYISKRFEAYVLSWKILQTLNFYSQIRLLFSSGWRTSLFFTSGYTQGQPLLHFLYLNI